MGFLIFVLSVQELGLPWESYGRYEKSGITLSTPNLEEFVHAGHARFFGINSM